MVTLIKALRAYAHGALARRKKRRGAGARQNTLRELDNHALRDLGLDRSEITSVAAEMSGQVERTRVRSAPKPRDKSRG